jgi:hypothetical protein
MSTINPAPKFVLFNHPYILRINRNLDSNTKICFLPCLRRQPATRKAISAPIVPRSKKASTTPCFYHHTAPPRYQVLLDKTDKRIFFSFKQQQQHPKKDYLPFKLHCITLCNRNPFVAITSEGKKVYNKNNEDADEAKKSNFFSVSPTFLKFSRTVPVIGLIPALYLIQVYQVHSTCTRGRSRQAPGTLCALLTRNSI